MTVPFACVAVAFAFIFLAKIPVGIAQQRAGGYDNRNPRDQQAKLEGWGRRALAAHQNAFEAFGPFAASVFVAHLGGADPKLTTPLALTFVAARLVYHVLYLADFATLRSTIWSVGLLATTGLFFAPLAR